MDKDITDPSFKYAPSQNPIDPLNSSGSAALPNTMAQQVDFVPSGDDFADIIEKQTRQRIADQNNAMMLSMSKAAAGNAEEAAAAQRLGYETGVGADIASRNKQLLEQRLATDRLAQLDLFKRDPVLARMLANKDFAAVAHDDLPNLMESGQQINPDLSLFEEFKIGRERGYKTTERGVTGADMLAASYSGVPIPESLRAKATQQSQEMADLRASGGFLESFGVLEGNIESMIPKQAEMALYGAVAGGLVLGAPTGGIGMVPGMVAGAGMGVMSAGVVQSFQLEGGNLFIDMLDDGIPEETARVAAPIGGAIMAALEILPLKFVTGEAKKLIKREVAGQVIDTLKQTGMLDVTKRFLQSYGIGVTTEVGTELAQDAVGTYVQEMAMLATDPLYEEKWKSEKGRAELAKQFVDTFIEVGQGMAIMGAFLPGANFIGDARRARKAKATRQFFKDIDKNASESKLKGRNPRSYQEWFEEKARGTANHTLFIDIEKLREAMAKNNVSAEQLETILPGVTKAIADAKGMSGIDFAFPTSVYAARLSDLAFGQALQEHMRFDPNDMSIAENNQYVKEREQIVEEMKKSAMELMKADAAIDQSAQAVADSVTAQLVATGRYTESESRSMSSVASAVATVMSARFNMTPLDWHNKYGSKVVGEGQAAPAAPQQVAPAITESEKLLTNEDRQELIDLEKERTELDGGSLSDRSKLEIRNRKFALIRRRDFEQNRPEIVRLLLEENAGVESDITKLVQLLDSSMGTAALNVAGAFGKGLISDLELSVIIKRLEAITDKESSAEFRIWAFGHKNKEIGKAFGELPMADEMNRHPKAASQLVAKLIPEIIAQDEARVKARVEKAATAPLEQASRIDAEYMAAVESGNVVEQQRMVDEAAKAAGYTIPVYHFTDKEFTSFDIQKGNAGPGIWLTASSEGWYGENKLNLYLNPGKIQTVKTQFDKSWREGELSIEGILEGDLETISQQNIDTLKNEDYTSTFYVATRPEQVKSADPITRDAAGNVIPLSRRFNIASTSILEQAAVPAPSTGVFDARNPPVSSEPIFAVMNADGQIYYDVNATMHGDLVETFPDIADTTIDGGFIIDGKYKMGMSDGGYSAFEGTSEQVEQVKEFTKQANAVSRVLEQAAKAKPGANSPGIGVGNEPKLGFWKPFRVKVVGDVEIPKKKLILTGTKNKNADKQLVNIDGILAKFPAAGESIEEWTKMMAYALGSNEVPIPPYAFIKGINGDGSFNTLSKLTEGQISDANHGFENAAELRAAYISGELSVTTTAKLILWSFLSRGVSPYRQESLFIDAFDKSAEWIGMAAEGKFSEKDFPAYDKWARSAAPKGSGLPGAGATHNLNAFGKDFLFKMSKIGDNGKSHLQNLHDMLSDPNQTGQSIRREFAKIGEGVGIDNKVMSFTLLVAGFDDVMVLDRVQIRQLWDDGRFHGVNLYDGTMNKKGKKISGSSMNDITEGVRGILVYEALERQLQLKIYDLYARLGRPQDASVGRYHWETWVAFSEQEASHGTLAAVLADAKGDDQAIANVASKEGEYGAYEYGAMYNRNAEGMPGFQYQTPSGNSYSFTVSAFREFLANIKLPKNGVVPTQFKVTESANAPWYTRPEVNQQRLDEQAAKWADLAGGTGEGKRITDEIIREQNANRARSATDAIAIASQWEVPALPDGSSTLERKFYAGGSATKFARVNRQQGIFDTHFSYERRTVADTEGLYRLGVPIVGEYSAGVGLAELYKRSGNATPTFYELGNTAAASEKFHAAIVENKQASPFGAAVAVYTPKEYRGMRLFLSADAKSGVAVKPDGDIVSVFAANNSGRALIELAVSAGGTKLDAYDTVLAHFYAPHGFVVASRIAWDEKQILEDWDKKTFSAFNNGEPDVVFMARDDAYMGSYKSTDGKLVTKYEDAVEIQSEAINVINEQLFQAMPSGKPRASIDLSTFITTLNTAADLSSYLHEMAHFYMVTYINIANEPGAPPQITADLQIIFDWLGIKDLAAWNAMTFEEQRKYWEAFAYNHEIYLFEGKSPSVEMQGVFDRFSAWLRAIYKNIRDELNAIYREKFGEDLPMLTPEIRGVMDRMLATEKQIKYAESVNNMTPLFLTQEQSGYDDARWAAYQAMVQEAHDQSVTDLTKASLRQMEWLSNARTRLLKEMQAKHDDIRDKMRSDIAEEVAAEPVYMAMSILKTGKGRVANGEMVVFSDKYKLNLAIVKKMIPAENLSKLGYGKFGMLSEDGLHPDMVAEMFGFKSGDELVLALLAAKPVKEEVDSRLDARMLAEYGDMNTPAEIEVQVQKALHNEARERFIGVEARFVASATRPVRVMIDAAQQAASTIVNAQKIENIRPSNYAAAEARAARDAADAYKQRQTPEQARKTSYTRSYNEQIAAGIDEATAVAEATKKGDQAAAAAKDRQDAFAAKYGNREPAQVIIRAKQAQVVQNQLVKVSTAALEEVDKAIKDFRKFFKADEKIAKSRNMDLVDAARSILAFYGLGKHDKLPSAYTNKLQAYNPEMYEAVKPIIEMSQQAGAGGNHETLTVSEFRMMREVVDALWMQSRRDKQAEIAGKMVSVAQIQAEFIARTEEIGIPADALGSKQALTANQIRIQDLMSAGALLQRVENWARRFDGPQEPGTVGPATKYIWRPVKNAVTAYKIDKNKYVKKYKELLDKVNLPVGKIRSDELDYTFGVGNGGNGKAELLGAMMHMGNESNLRKLLVGRNWATIAADDSIDTARWDAFVERMINEGKLTKEDFEFLQATWDLNEEIKPIAQKAHRDLYGYYFNEIEAKSFTNRFGTYRGGYVPAKTDATIVRDAQRQAKMEELESDFRAAMPSTGMGFTMGRVEYNEPLSMDARLIAGHIDSVLRFSHIQPAVKDVLKIIGRGKFADNLTAIQPFAIDDVLLPWLNRTARQTTSVPGFNKRNDRFWNALRKRTGMAIMMGSVRNALQQFTGWFPAALLVSKGELKNALSTYLRHPMKTAANVASLSPFMNDYMHSQIFEMQDRMNQLLLNPSKYERFKDWVSHHAYFLQTAFQNIVNVVTWTAKYNQVLSEIDASISDSEAQAEAIQQADAAVRLTQGGMSPEDVARFQVSTPFINSMTQFMGFFNMTANLNADEFVMVFRDLGWRGNKGKLMMIYILGLAAPALVSDAISRSLGQGWDDDDDGYLDDVADWFFGSQARFVTAMVPFGSAAYTAIMAPYNEKPYDDRITSSPSISSLEASTIGVGKAVINIADDDKELTGKNVRDVLTLVTNVTGIPLSVLGRPISYQVDIERGAVEPTDPIDYMRGLITGVPSAESKKK